MNRNLTASILLILLIYGASACAPTEQDAEISERPLPTITSTATTESVDQDKTSNEEIIIDDNIHEASPTPTANPTPENTAQPPIEDERPATNIITTKMGDFRVTESHLQDEVIGGYTSKGEKFLLVVLTHPDGSMIDPETFSLEEFQDNGEGQVAIKWVKPPDRSLDHLVKLDDSYLAFCPMGGWINDDFVVGCTVPHPADEYWFHWGYESENEPILLSPEE